MGNPNTDILITSVAIQPGSGQQVVLGYSNGNGNVTEQVSKGTARITYSVAPAQAPWKVWGCVTDNSASDIHASVNQAAGTLTISDQATVQDQLKFQIQLTNDGGKTVYISPDPVIINVPPK